MSKHTPGPWRVDGNNFVWGARSSDYEVCHVPLDADAYLVAAAPEMLGALQAIAQLAHNGGFPDMSADELRKLLFGCGNRAMIAIAKATGEK